MVAAGAAGKAGKAGKTPTASEIKSIFIVIGNLKD